jgi:serine/threonine-protein kinase 24/25/MST4
MLNFLLPYLTWIFSGAPPAYSGSVRSSRRASYAARTSVNGAGTILTEADLGTGVDTIRPVKKVDGAGSLRLSTEFVGSMRKDGDISSPRSPTVHKRAASEAAKAGRILVEDVVLPILSKVGLSDLFLLLSTADSQCQ